MPGLCEMHLSGSWPGLTLPRASFSCFSDAACFMLASRTILWASWEEGRLCVSGEGPARSRQTRSPTRPPAGRPRYLEQAGRQLLQLPFQLLPHLGQPLALLVLQLQLLRGPGWEPSAWHGGWEGTQARQSGSTARVLFRGPLSPSLPSSGALQLRMRCPLCCSAMSKPQPSASLRAQNGPSEQSRRLEILQKSPELVSPLCCPHARHGLRAGAQGEPMAPSRGAPCPRHPRSPTFWALCSSSFRNSEPFSRISMEELRRRNTSSRAAAGPSSPWVSSPPGLSARPPGDSLWLLQGPTLFQGTGTASLRGGGWPSSGWGWLRGKQQVQGGGPETQN